MTFDYTIDKKNSFEKYLDGKYMFKGKTKMHLQTVTFITTQTY